jgi:hypothetical protein
MATLVIAAAELRRIVLAVEKSGARDDSRPRLTLLPVDALCG